MSTEQIDPRTLEMLAQALSKKQESIAGEQERDSRETAEMLIKRYKEYIKQYEFEVGQLVQWKVGLKNRKRPKYGEPAIILELLDKPLYDTEQDSGTPYFYEPLTVRLAVLDREGDFLIYYYDINRFEPYISK